MVCAVMESGLWRDSSGIDEELCKDRRGAYTNKVYHPALILF